MPITCAFKTVWCNLVANCDKRNSKLKSCIQLLNFVVCGFIKTLAVKSAGSSCAKVMFVARLFLVVGFSVVLHHGLLEGRRWKRVRGNIHRHKWGRLFMQLSSK